MTEQKEKKERKLIPAGTHTTKVKNWGAQLSKNNVPMAWIKFDNGSFWQGYFSGDATQYTVETLVKLGFKGSTPNDLNNDSALVKDFLCEIVVEHEKFDGKIFDKVKWINTPYQRKDLDASDIQTLKGIDLRGYVSQLKDKAPEQSKEQQPAPTAENTYTDEDMPDWAKN